MRSLTLMTVAAAVGISALVLPATSIAAAPRTSTFTAEVWADNWFALYANGKKVGQDSVPLTTERSFNAETITFTATYPLVIGIFGKDYSENASGLEYIGTSRQQIGDGGLIAQIRDTKTGRIVAATDGNWQVLVLDKAPLNPSCVTSKNPLADCQSLTVPVTTAWSTSRWSPKGWSKAIVYTPEAVGVKDGYNTITWAPQAKLVWGTDLKLDNTVLFRAVAVAS